MEMVEAAYWVLVPKSARFTAGSIRFPSMEKLDQGSHGLVVHGHFTAVTAHFQATF